MTIEDSPSASTALKSGRPTPPAAVDQQEQHDHDDAGDAEQLAVDALEGVDEGHQQTARPCAVGRQTGRVAALAILMTAFSCR